MCLSVSCFRRSELLSEKLIGREVPPTGKAKLLLNAIIVPENYRSNINHPDDLNMILFWDVRAVRRERLTGWKNGCGVSTEPKDSALQGWGAGEQASIY